MRWIEDQLAAALAASFTTDERAIAARSVADTMAVAAAGFRSERVRRVAAAYHTADGRAKSWDGGNLCTDEDAALVNAVAAHALEFDDLDEASSAHLSCVVVPALLAESPGWTEDDLLDAILSAGIAARSLATWLGPDHYGRGWHATSTIGMIAACIALARLRRVDAHQLTNVISIAVGQMGGTHANFGSDVKALHAGFAAAAARRAIRLNEYGVMGAADVLHHPIFRTIYGSTALPSQQPNKGPARPSAPLVKLYPCCFAIHRAITAALVARAALGEQILRADTRFILTLPAGTQQILRTQYPTNSTESAFSPPFCCAVALSDGAVALHHFEDGFADPRYAALAERIETCFAEPDAETGDRTGVAIGVAKLEVIIGGRNSHRFVQSAMPGSHDDPMLDQTLRAKILNCLQRYNATAERDFSELTLLSTLPRVKAWLG